MGAAWHEEAHARTHVSWTCAKKRHETQSRWNAASTVVSTNAGARSNAQPTAGMSYDDEWQDDAPITTIRHDDRFRDISGVKVCEGV